MMFWLFSGKPLGLAVTLFKLPLSQFISRASQTYDATARTNKPLIFMSAFILDNGALKPLLTRDQWEFVFKGLEEYKILPSSNKVIDASASQDGKPGRHELSPPWPGSLYINMAACQTFFLPPTPPPLSRLSVLTHFD